MIFKFHRLKCRLSISKNNIQNICCERNGIQLMKHFRHKLQIQFLHLCNNPFYGRNEPQPGRFKNKKLHWIFSIHILCRKQKVCFLLNLTRYNLLLYYFFLIFSSIIYLTSILHKMYKFILYDSNCFSYCIYFPGRCQQNKSVLEFWKKWYIGSC